MSSPDIFQTQALIDVGKHFRWKRFCIIADDNDYGTLTLQINDVLYSKAGKVVNFTFDCQ